MAREPRISGMSIGQVRMLLRGMRNDRWLARVLVAGVLVVCGMGVHIVLPYANADDSVTPTPAPSAVTTATPAPPPATPNPGVALISADIHGTAGNGPSNEVALDGDGNVAVFYSDATNLITGNAGHQVRDVFLRDSAISTTMRIPPAPEPNGASHAAGGAPAVDSSGNVVAFYTAATNLDAAGQPGLFVYYRGTGAPGTGVLERVCTGRCFDPSISRDGKIVAFQSPESNLVPNDTNKAADIFVVDLGSGTPGDRNIQRVCDAIQPNGNSYSPSVSGDGSFVAFASAATNLAANDNNRHIDVFVASRATDGTYPCDGVNGAIGLASVSGTGQQGDGDSVLPAICADGSVVAFKSLADNLVDNDRNGVADVFARDRVRNGTARISVDPNGHDANDASFPPAISPDCRFVAFGSAATNLVRGDANDASDVFVRDRVIGETRLVDVNARGEQANGGVSDVAPSISGDDLHIGFASFASNLADNDFNDTTDVFVALRPGCGNGILEPGEQCDDRNLNDGDCCSSTCTIEPPGPCTTPDDNPCTLDQCDGVNPTCQHPAGHAGAECRAAAGECDVAETCTGTSADCPADTKKSPGTACTDDGNSCTLDQCDGTHNDCQHPAGNAGAACPNDGNSCTLDQCDGTHSDCQHPAGNAGAVCRAAAGECDLPETCTGTSTECPPDDGKKPPGTVCRAAVNECDIVETCDGTSNTCPADTVKAQGTACTDDGKVCTTDLCNGTVGAPACVHDPGHGGTVCRAAAGDCDVAEACTGTSADCPPDGFKPPSVCRPATNECDIAENCTGTSATCPADAVKSPGTACTDDGKVCTTDLCNGTVGAAACVHAPGNPGVVCRPAAGDCDVAEACTGSSADCPADSFQPSSVVCRAAAGDCDVAEACTGSSAVCPTNAFKPQGTSCTDDGNVCTNDVCPGDGVTCGHPAKPNGTTCDDGRADTTNDTCQGGVCVGQPKLDSDACNCNVAPPDRRTYRPMLLGLGIPLALIWWRRRFRG